MARTIQEHYDIIVAQKNAEPSLDVITTPSLVGILNGWAYVSATILHDQEVFMDRFYSEVEVKSKSAVAGPPDWYLYIASLFQYGDPLQVIKGVVDYAVIDESKRIIAAAAYSSDTSTAYATLKVAKLLGDDLIQLSTDELNAFKAYIDKRGFAGCKVLPVSVPADLMKIYGHVLYDPLYDLPTIQSLVEIQMKSYLQLFKFDSTIRVNDLIQVIRNVPGVIDCSFSDLQVKNDGGVYLSVSEYFVPSAGYVRLDPAFSINSTLTYNVD